MQRTTILACLALVALVAVQLFAVGGAWGSEAAGRPNIVVILADDLGYSDLGCYGGEIPTPQLDALAAGGLRFTQFYNNAVCGPSRASLLTGLYAQRIGHTGRNWNQPTNYARSLTVGEVLQRAGYRTLMVGKWQDPEHPADRGFHRFYGPHCAGKISYFHEVQLNPFYLDRERVSLPQDFYLTDALTDHAVQFLEEHGRQPAAEAQPFFLYVAHLAPHWPLHAREADIAPHRARYRQLGWDACREQRRARQRELGLLPAEWAPPPQPAGLHAWSQDKFPDWQAERMAVYAAQVASVDRSTGRILSAIRKLGQEENTLVLFLSDNGAAPDGGLAPTDRLLGFAPNAPANRQWRLDRQPIRPGSGPDNLPGPPDTFAAYGIAWAHASNAPLRATKITGYEGGIRTPLIAHWPRGIEARGKLVADVGHVIDLLPTCLELAGGEYPRELGSRRPLPLDGRSLTPLFRGQPRPPHEFLAWQAPQHQALREGDWKIIRPNPQTPWELYDLARDGGESANLAARQADVVERLARRWQAWADSCGLAP